MCLYCLAVNFAIFEKELRKTHSLDLEKLDLQKLLWQQIFKSLGSVFRD